MFYKNKIAFFVAFFLSFLYAFAGSIVSVIRYWQYEVFYFDFGIFDTAIWNVSRFSLPIIDHIALGEKIIFADHFSPSIFILAPLFWLFPHSETLFVAQASMVAASGFVLFLIARHVLKNSFYAISIMSGYFLFVGLQNAVITDFHEVTIATLFLMLTFLYIVKKKKKMYFLVLLLLLGSKESMFLLGIGVSIALFFIRPSWRKIAYSTLIISLLWGLASIKLIIPFFSEGRYFYETQLSPNPIAIFSSFFDSPIKQHTLLYTFLSFGFLPLLSPVFWPLIFQDFLVRFYPASFTTRWDMGLHYSALIAVIMGLASVYSVAFLKGRLKSKAMLVIMIAFLLNAVFLYRFILRGPFGLFYNPAFYAHTKDFAFLDNVVKKIPRNASVMTQNNLASHFTHQKVWLLQAENRPADQEYYTQKQPDYILIDNRAGQNPNNYWGVKDMNFLLNTLRNDNKYKLIYKSSGQFLFGKVGR
ncbi:DUF2079 domain-containing protein [Patescibacteria group bacterium]|nr:DUF2079 domain-containing protein [Patescibacteria group bacterium]